MRTVRQQQAAARRELEALDRNDNHADTARDLLTRALDLLARPGDVYDHGDDITRTLLVKTIFAKVYLEPTPDGAVTVADVEREDPFDVLDELATEHHEASSGSGHLITPHQGTRRAERRKNTRGAAPKNRAPGVSAKGSSNTHYVELRGIEPLTFSMRTRRATNCATAP